jgi:hypothetical protein
VHSAVEHCPPRHCFHSQPEQTSYDHESLNHNQIAVYMSMLLVNISVNQGPAMIVELVCFQSCAKISPGMNIAHAVQEDARIVPGHVNRMTARTLPSSTPSLPCELQFRQEAARNELPLSNSFDNHILTLRHNSHNLNIHLLHPLQHRAWLHTTQPIPLRQIHPSNSLPLHRMLQAPFENTASHRKSHLGNTPSLQLD